MGMEHLYLGKMVGDRFHTNWCIENWNQEECSCKRYGLDTADLEQEAKEYREGMLEWAVIKAKVESELEDIERGKYPSTMAIMAMALIFLIIAALGIMYV